MAIKLVKIFAENISSTKLAYYKYIFIEYIIIIIFVNMSNTKIRYGLKKRKIQAEKKGGERESVIKIVKKYLITF